MSMVLNEGAQGDPRNALFLAQACALAYLDELAAQPRFADQLGLEAKLISVDNTQVYVAENDGAVVVAFRGSQAPTTLDGLKDWLLTDADDHLIIPVGREGTDFAAAGVGARSMGSGSPCWLRSPKRWKRATGRSGSRAIAWEGLWRSWPPGGFSATSSRFMRLSPSARP